MRNYFCTFLLIVVNVIVFILIWTSKLDEDDLSVSYHTVFNLRQYYRILTSAFTHSDPMYILFNMISLYNVGTFVEAYFGHFWMLVIYFVSLILGRLMALYIRHNNRDDYTMTLGASGAICGMLGAYFMTVLHYYGFSGFSYLLRPMVSLVMISVLPGVDGTSHFSCMAAGMAITYLLFLF